MYFLAAVAISARSAHSRSIFSLPLYKMKLVQRQENAHRNKVCKFKLYYSRKFRVLRSTKSKISKLLNHNSVPGVAGEESRGVMTKVVPVSQLTFLQSGSSFVDSFRFLDNSR